MKQLEDIAVCSSSRRPSRQFPFASPLRPGELAALRRAFKAAAVPSAAAELAALRSRVEDMNFPAGQRSDCLKVIGQLTLGNLNQAGFKSHTEAAKVAVPAGRGEL